MYSFEQLFALESYSHRQLLDPQQNLWEPLINLPAYIISQNLGKIYTNVPKDCHLIHPESIFIGENTLIQPGVMIEGPCIIGKHCTIRHGAYIRSNVLIGDYCTIGHSSEIKQSILLNRSAAAHFNYVGDSIVGNGVNLGAGVVLANYRFDGKEIAIFHEGKKHPTTLKKFGAIIGDHSGLGCNSVTNPGTILPKNYTCPPCSCLKGMINN